MKPSANNCVLLVHKTKDSFVPKILLDDELPQTLPTTGKHLLLTYAEAKQLLPLITEFLLLKENSRYFFSTPESIDRLMLLVCHEFGIDSIEELHSKSRKKHIVAGRQLVASILKWGSYGGLAAVGKFFGQDHATVLHSIKTIKNYLDTRDERFFQPIINVLVNYSAIPEVPKVRMCSWCGCKENFRLIQGELVCNQCKTAQPNYEKML